MDRVSFMHVEIPGLDELLWGDQSESLVINGWHYAFKFVIMILFVVSLMVISHVYRSSNHYVGGEIPAEKPEDQARIQREELLLTRVASLEIDVQAANEDSTAWMTRFHEQCSENLSLSRQIDRAASSLGSRLTYLDLKAQVQDLEIKCKSLSSELRDSERGYLMLKDLHKEKQGRLLTKVANLEGRIAQEAQHARKHATNFVQATKLRQEEAGSASLRQIIASKDRELQAQTQKMSRLEAINAQNQTTFREIKHGLDEELIQKNYEITKLKEQAAKDISQSKARAAQNQTHLNKVKCDMDNELTEKNNEISQLQEKAAKDSTIARARISDLEQQLVAKTREVERSNAALSEKRAELESLTQKVASFEARDKAIESETLAPTAPEGMDLDSPQQMQLESQSKTLAEQQEQISDLEQSKKSLSKRLHSVEESAHSEIQALKKQITEQKEVIQDYRMGDQDMSDAFVADTHGRVGEVTENFNEVINMQSGQLVILRKENDDLKATLGQHQSLERGGMELPDATIARLRKEKEEMNTNLQKARKLADNLKKERDQHRQAKTTLTHENSELTKSQRQNVEELKKLREEYTKTQQQNVEELKKLNEEYTESQRQNVEELKKLREKCARWKKTVAYSQRKPPDPTKRSATDDEGGEASEKRVRRSSNT